MMSIRLVKAFNFLYSPDMEGGKPPFSVFRWLLFLLPLFLIPGCGYRSNGKQENKKINVTFWHSMGMRHSVILNQIIADFEKENPDVYIHSIYQGSYNSLLTTLIASNTAGTNPVMSQMYESWTTRFIEHDMIFPVIDLAKEYGGLDKNDLDDFIRGFIEDNTWNQKLITLPFNKSAYVLYFNRDAMKEIGLTDEFDKGRAPVTWKEMRLACKRLTKKSEGEVIRYGLGIRPFIEGYTTFLFRAGGRYMDPVGKRVRFADDTGLDTLRFLYDLVYKDKTAYVESDYLSTAFGSGRIAMFVGSTASLPYNEKAVSGKFDWDTAPIPFPEGKVDLARTLFQGTNVGIFRNHSQQKLEAAWRFMRFLTKTESATTWSIGTGYLPIRYSVLETDRMKKHLEEFPSYKTPVSLLDNAQFEPRVLIWEPMRTVITDHVEAAMNGRRTPEETIKSMKSECEKIIDTF